MYKCVKKEVDELYWKYMTDAASTLPYISLLFSSVTFKANVQMTLSISAHNHDTSWLFLTRNMVLQVFHKYILYCITKKKILLRTTALNFHLTGRLKPSLFP